MSRLWRRRGKWRATLALLGGASAAAHHGGGEVWPRGASPKCTRFHRTTSHNVVSERTNLSSVTKGVCARQRCTRGSLIIPHTSRRATPTVRQLWVRRRLIAHFAIAEPPDEGWPEEEGDYGPEGEGPVEAERDAWFEFRSVMDAAHLSSITACAFDPFEELLWTGSAAVRTAALPPPSVHCGVTGPPRVVPESRHGALHCAPYSAPGDPSHTRGGGGRADRGA